jgi:hypothetical protein
LMFNGLAFHFLCFAIIKTQNNPPELLLTGLFDTYK